MLTMDLAGLSKAELAEAVSQYCLPFGEIDTISILQPPESPRVAFALVSMSSSEALDLIVNKFGAAKIAALAVIRIEQRPRDIPSFLLKVPRPAYASSTAY